MPPEKNIFKTNPEKAISRLTINAFMMGSLFLIFTLIWTLTPEKFSLVIVSQLTLAIPLLFVSSLAYTKIGYWKETKLWDMFGWFTQTVANGFIFNVVGIMTGTFSFYLSVGYFLLIIVLMGLYTAINISYKPETLKEKMFKYFFLVAVFLIGGIMPVML